MSGPRHVAPAVEKGHADGHPVQVEVIFLRHAPAERNGLAYRVARSSLPDGATPDATAAALCHRVGAPDLTVEVLHSTSWRHHLAHGVILTYAALPDPRPDLPGSALHAPSVVCSGDPLRPTPDVLHDHHVAAHAVRHLTYLLDHDPGIAATAGHAHLDALWGAMRAAASIMPTGPHAQTHRAAERQETADRERPAS